MTPYLIDEAGNKWIAGDPLLRTHLMAGCSQEALIRFAVENLGWVKVHERPRGLRIACRPGFLTDQSLAMLLMSVYDANPVTIALDVLDTNWEHLLIRDRQAFVRLLSGLVSGHRDMVVPSELRYLSAPSSERNSALALPTKVATTCLRLANKPSDVHESLDVIFHGRWHICSLDTETGHSIAQAIGNSFTPFNPGWHDLGLNQSLCMYGDPGYGLWVAAHHRRIVATQQAVFDDVDAIVSFPRIGETRLRYRRISLPIDYDGGRSVVLSAAVSDSSVDLRQLAG